MPNYTPKIGTYAFALGLYIASEGQNRQIPTAKLPRADGARVLTGYLTEKRFEVRGGFVKAPGGIVRATLDTLKAALAACPTTFQAYDDRYWKNVQAVNYSDTYQATWYGKIVEVSFELVTGDPFACEVNSQSFLTNAVAASPTTVNFTAGGDAYALPELRLTVGGSGAVALAATVTNTTTGEAFTLSGAVTGGNVIIVDSSAKTVVIGGVDKSALFDGLFPRLAPGVVNAFTVAYTSGTITNLGATWQNRWY